MTSSVDSTSAKRPSKPLGKNSSHYASAAETKLLLRRSLAARIERLEAGDMLTTDQAAEMAGTTRVTINAWIAKGRAIGLTQARRGFRLPRWQFQPGMWDLVPRLAKALGTNDGWTLLAFLETPLDGLDGFSPRQAVEQGEAERVVMLAAAEGY